LDFGTDLIPGIGQVKAGSELVTGETFRGEEVGTTGRVVAGLSLIPGAAVIKKLARLGDVAGFFKKGAGVTDDVADVSRRLDDVPFEAPKRAGTGSAVGEVVTPNNYRAVFLKARPDLPKDWVVHHMLPQRYRELIKSAGVDIDDLQFLRGVDPKIHAKITTEWARFHKRMGGDPTAADVARFAEEIERRFGDHFIVPGY
jgi:hypothetical protein